MMLMMFTMHLDSKYFIIIFSYSEKMFKKERKNKKKKEIDFIMCLIFGFETLIPYFKKTIP